MKQWQILEWGKLAPGEFSSLPLAATQVRVKIRAVSLNYRDHLMLQGQYNPRQPLPLVPCSDGAGEVVEVGSAVKRWQVGDRVCPIFSQSWIGGPPNRERISQTLGGPLDGTLRPEMVLDEQGLVRIPAHLDWEEAACLPCAAVTAWNAIRDQPAGSRIVVQGTGGVSLFALQLAKAAGMEVLLTSSSQQKMARAGALGADHCLDYRENPEWSRGVRAWARDGVDCVVEVGGAGTLEQSLKCLKPGGKIAMIGILAGASKPLNVLPILMQQLRVQGVLVGNRDDFEAMNRLLEQTRIRPVLDQRLPYAQAPQAWERLASGQHFGKVAISGCW
ncbi:MAG: NAD(P)-dependent alcohol dehydrogenase [Candidatus Eremiobacteraeota bacterium]|nr:NAD(P)-dependent alcohol dehydrogenase [Candidatus Eremiobacteraeota bacterium]MCW5870262.1 NAD(P)-dependent alcohol dehydrogenase [Candidatus Eremiobacteraeota bacterium]